MADAAVASAATSTTGSALTVPADVAAKFADLIEMIKKSRSMDDEERQYWVDALSIMSEDQIANLRSILENEQRQIKEAEEAYSKGVDQAAKQAKAEFDEEAYKEKKQARVEAEQLAEHHEKAEEEALLASLENL